MNKYVKIVLFLIASLLVTSSLFTQALAVGGGGKSTVIKYWSYDGVTRDRSMAPIYIQYNPAVASPQYKRYGNKKFWEEYYPAGDFLWYSPVPPMQLIKSNKDYDRSVILENGQTQLGKDATPEYRKWFVDRSWNLNLKKGRHALESQGHASGYMGDNSGTTLMTVNYSGTSPVKGKNYEWRYLAYNDDGEIIANPWFPPDHLSGDKITGQNRVWIKNPWTNPLTRNMEIAKKTAYDDNKAKKVAALKNLFFDKNPEFLLPAKSGENMNSRKQRSANHWADYFTLRSNPEWSSATLIGFHSGPAYCSPNCGGPWHIVFALDAPPKPNLRLIEYKITDSATGKVIATVKRNATYNSNMTVTTTKDKSTPYLKPGHTYNMTATVKNMNVPGLKGKNTTYTPVGLDVKAAYDNQIGQVNQWSYQSSSKKREEGSALPSNGQKTIQYNKTVGFNKMSNGKGGSPKWQFTVPNDGSVKEEVKLRAELPIGFYLKNENTLTQDDFLEVVLPLEPNDIETPKNAELIDVNGNTVDEIEPGQMYGVRFFIEKNKGTMPVGDRFNPTLNPFASLSVKIQSANTSISKVIKTNQVMDHGDRVSVTLERAITPSVPWIEATWQISQIHRDKQQSTIYTNDGPYKKRWDSDVNMSVSNFELSPKVIYRGNNQPMGYENVEVNAQIMNANPTNESKEVDIVVTGNSKSWTFREMLPANRKFDFNSTLTSVPIAAGDMPFKIEVNPVKNGSREHIEYRKNGGNPYADNVATNAILAVKDTTTPAYCEATHTQNSWTQTYTSTYYDTYRSRQAYYTNCKYDEYGKAYDCRVAYRDVTGMRYNHSTQQTLNHQESYKLTAVWFRSKSVEDEGGQWINVLNEPGKIKAGYGFEIKYDVKYATSLELTPPTPYHNGYPTSYTTNRNAVKTISKQHGAVTPPNALSVEMPFKNDAGQKVKYQLTQISSTGSWGNRTMTYGMPVRSVMGQGTTREVFVNESAKDGNYSIRIDTAPFYGHPDKPVTSRMLCDTRSVVLQVKGSNSDDLKTHITQ